MHEKINNAKRRNACRTIEFILIWTAERGLVVERSVACSWYGRMVCLPGLVWLASPTPMPPAAHCRIAGFPTQGVFFVHWTKTEYLLHFQLCSHHVLILKATTTQVLSKPRTPLWLPTSLPTQPSGSVYAHAHARTRTPRYRHSHARTRDQWANIHLHKLKCFIVDDFCWWVFFFENGWFWTDDLWILWLLKRSPIQLCFLEVGFVGNWCFFSDYCLTWSIGLTHLQITRFTVWTLRLCKLYCSDEHWTIYQLQQPFLMHYYFVFVLKLFV